MTCLRSLFKIFYGEKEYLDEEEKTKDIKRFWNSLKCLK